MLLGLPGIAAGFLLGLANALAIATIVYVSLA